MRKIRWGILGPGIIARRFADDMRHSETGILAAVASRSGERAHDIAKEFGIPRHYGSYDELYRDPDVDAVYVATPHNFHFEQSAAALRHGKAVLCEKPLTESLEKSSALVDIARDTGVYLMEGMWTWFLPAIRKAKEWVIQGRIGTIRHIHASFGYPLAYDPEHRGYNPDLAGGVLLDMGIYPLALARLFIDEEPVSTHVTAHLAPTGTDDDISWLMEYPGSVAFLSASFRVKLPNWAYISGDRGMIAIPDFWRANECYLYEGEKLADHFTDGRKGTGFEFEIDGVGRDMIAGKVQSDIVPHSASTWFIRRMEEISNHRRGG